MRFGQREFRPGLIPTLMTLLLLPILIRLGFWQMERAEEKRAIQEQYAQRAAEPEIVAGSESMMPEAIRYRRVRATGYYDNAHQFLLDNKVHQGLAGYHVITPLKLAGTDTVVLINRGWLAQGRSRQDLPRIPVTEDLVTVRGVASIPPAEVLSMTDSYREGASWPAVIQWLDMPQMQIALGVPLQAYVIRLDDEPGSGFVRNWKRINMAPEKSDSYALQWFSLAAALVIIYIGVNLKRVDKD